LGAHDRYRGLAQPQRTEKISVQDGTHFFFSRLFYCADEPVPGVVHEYVESPERGYGLRNRGDGTEPVADVELLYEQALVVRERMRASNGCNHGVIRFECGTSEGSAQPAIGTGDHPRLGGSHLSTVSNNWTHRLVWLLCLSMARTRTRILVYDAVLSLAQTGGFGSISMEGVAARAGVSKQTLYRTWPSTGAILFDALLDRSVSENGKVVVPNSGDLATDLNILVAATIAELTDPTHEPLLRAVTADIQTDEALAAQFHDRLLMPQLSAISDRLREGSIDDPDAVAELLLGPILHRWLLRTRPFEASWASAHVQRVLRGSATYAVQSP
jgi:AcrR family transcriptional regulator